MSRIKRYIDSLIEAGVNVFGNDDYESYQNYLYEKYGFDTSPEESDKYVVKSSTGEVVTKTSCLSHAFHLVDTLRDFLIQNNLEPQDFKVYGV